MKKITQKQLIDYCNNAPWGHCSICPYDSKECKIYCTKYDTPPAGEHYYNPERYTDEEILLRSNEQNVDFEQAIEYLKKELNCHNRINADCEKSDSGWCDSCPNYVTPEAFYQALQIVVDAERRTR